MSGFPPSPTPRSQPSLSVERDGIKAPKMFYVAKMQSNDPYTSSGRSQYLGAGLSKCCLLTLNQEQLTFSSSADTEVHKL